MLGGFALAVLLPASAALASEASWRFAPAQAPPPPPGTAPAPYGVPLGNVGEISFWSPSRGLLITGGTEVSGGPVPSGVYAYDGVSWHQLASVCGGGEGRIVWAGPDEFWTISDQRAGQVLVTGGKQTEAPSLSLCHFLGDRVVGSYAVPLDEPESWLQMTAGACYSPSDCWFGGVKARPPKSGAFHLQWDGSEVSVVYGPEDHSVTGMAVYEGSIYESVQFGEKDEWLSGESREQPAILHSIAPSGAEPFSEAFVYSSSAKHALPIYGEHVLPEALQGFDLATDGAPNGAGATSMWAAANPSREPPRASRPAAVTVLRDVGGEWSQVLPGAGGTSQLGGATLAGAPLQVSTLGVSDAIAPEPGGETAWLSLHDESVTGAEVALLNADGQIVETDVLPSTGTGVGYSGEAGPIVCPAQHDCWMATLSESGPSPGWLFHLSDGEHEPQNTDPLFDGADGVISSRPPDAGLPVIYPDGPAVDDSLANQAPPAPPIEPPAPAPTVKKVKAKRLVKEVKSRFEHHRTLVISFVLTGKAHVQLIARRDGRIVAKTPRRQLRAGRHRLSLTFDPAHWPTKLQFEVKPPGSPGSSGSSGLSNSESVST